MGKRNSAHHEFIVDDNGPMPSEKSTGIVFSVVFAVLAIVFRNDPSWAAGMLAMSILFAGLTVFASSWLSPLNRAWFALALFLNRIVSPIVMLVIYALAIVPFGLVMQLRADPLRRKQPADATSYWVSKSGSRVGNMRDQF